MPHVVNLEFTPLSYRRHAYPITSAWYAADEVRSGIDKEAPLISAQSVRRALGMTAALLLVLVAATPSRAQSMFYREVQKDGRIYVFADAQRYEAWEQSGGAEIGVAITRLGFGPNGETVVFDSEDAVNLYNFKHDKPGEVFPKPKPKEVSPFPSGKVNGLAFGDLYWFPDHHDPRFDHQQGFWFRRVYLGYDLSFSPTMSMRARLEMNSNGLFAGGSLTPFVKDAYFTWKYHGRQQARLGIEPALTFDSEESFFGLRHIEKTPADLYGIDSSRDFGLAFTGPIREGGLSYGVQFGNDSSQNSETDKLKVVRFLGLYEPRSGLRVEGAFNYGKRPNRQDRTTAKGLLGFKKNAFRGAAQYVWQRRKSGTATPDTTIGIWSAFGNWDIKPKKAALFARFDSVKGRRGGADVGLPGADGIAFWSFSNAAPFKFYLAGLEFYLNGSIRVSPNVEWVSYDDPTTGPSIGKDVAPRLTFFWTW
jgi:hypothetical protein